MNLKQCVAEYLEKARLMQIATSKNNKPWVATVWFAYDQEFNFYFTSRKSRRHSLEIKNNQNIAGAIVKPHKTLGVKVQGLQFEGKAKEVGTGELVKAFSLYLKRFPMAVMHIKSTQDIINNLTEQRVYKIIPSKIVFFDEISFSKNPRQELNL